MNRGDLLLLCERAVVHQSQWRDRDSAGAQRNIGEVRALLLAGCEFIVRTDQNTQSTGTSGLCVTNEDTIWVEIEFQGFDYFEEGLMTKENFYLPTQERLDKRRGKDWY